MRLYTPKDDFDQFFDMDANKVQQVKQELDHEDREPGEHSRYYIRAIDEMDEEATQTGTWPCKE